MTFPTYNACHCVIQKCLKHLEVTSPKSFTLRVRKLILIVYKFTSKLTKKKTRFDLPLFITRSEILSLLGEFVAIQQNKYRAVRLQPDGMHDLNQSLKGHLQHHTFYDRLNHVTQLSTIIHCLQYKRDLVLCCLRNVFI